MPDHDKAVTDLVLTVKSVNYDGVKLTLVVNNFNGKKRNGFDFSNQTKVDYLVCHEQTGTYKKFPAGAGNPVSKPMVFKGNGKTYHPPQWYNGSINAVKANDMIDPGAIVQINWPVGDLDDPNSRISPSKVHQANLNDLKISKVYIFTKKNNKTVVTFATA